MKCLKFCGEIVGGLFAIGLVALFSAAAPLLRIIHGKKPPSA